MPYFTTILQLISTIIYIYYHNFIDNAQSSRGMWYWHIYVPIMEIHGNSCKFAWICANLCKICIIYAKLHKFAYFDAKLSHMFSGVVQSATMILAIFGQFYTMKSHGIGKSGQSISQHHGTFWQNCWFWHKLLPDLPMWQRFWPILCQFSWSADCHIYITNAKYLYM